MKMEFCRDAMLSADCRENLNAEQSRKWREQRMQKLQKRLEAAAMKGIRYVVFLGCLFGAERVAETLIDGLFKAAAKNREVQLLLLLNAEELRFMNHRDDIPDNVHILSAAANNSYQDEELVVCVKSYTIEMECGKCVQLKIEKSLKGDYKLVIPDMPEKNLMSFEPLGFTSTKEKYGYSILEWSDTGVTDYEEREESDFRYILRELHLTPEDGEKEIHSQIEEMAREMDERTFLHLDVKGETAFAFMPDAVDMKARLEKRLLYAEVYINTSMNMDESQYGKEISLRSTFVNLIKQDETLEDAEKERIICLGWNALMGKEASGN